MDDQHFRDLVARALADIVHSRQYGLRNLGYPNPSVDPDSVATCDKIVALYNSGKPFYSKEVFSRVELALELLDLAEPEPTMKFKGIDGSEVKQVVTFNGPYDPSMMPFVKLQDVRDMVDVVQYNWLDQMVRDTVMSPLTVSVMRTNPIHQNKGKPYWNKRFEDVTAEWLESKTCQLLITLLNECRGPIDQVNKIICFGLGYFPCDETGRYPNPRSTAQYAMALTVAEFVSKQVGMRIPVFSQEPFADPVTIEILQEHGIITYEGSGRATHGFIDVDDNTLVISIFPGAPVRAVIADIARPRLLICNGYVREPKEQELAFWNARGAAAIPVSQDPVSPRVRAMLLDDYLEAPLVGDMLEEQPDTPFSRIFVYMPRPPAPAAQEDKGEGKGKEVEVKEDDESEDLIDLSVD